MNIGHCFECDSRMEVAIYDFLRLEGAIVPICDECKNTVPEDILWDLSVLEEGDEFLDNHLLDNDEKWVIRNRHSSDETYREYLQNRYNGDFSDVSVESKDEYWDIFVHDASDEKAIEEARDALRKTMNR